MFGKMDINHELNPSCVVISRQNAKLGFLFATQKLTEQTGGPAQDSQNAKTAHENIKKWKIFCSVGLWFRLAASLFPRCVAHCQSDPFSHCCKCVRKLRWSNLYSGHYSVIAESLSCLCGSFHNTVIFFGTVNKVAHKGMHGEWKNEKTAWQWTALYGHLACFPSPALLLKAAPKLHRGQRSQSSIICIVLTTLYAHSHDRPHRDNNV